jgi:hypothetical protein
MDFPNEHQATNISSFISIFAHDHPVFSHQLSLQLIYLCIARQGIHINRINAENINEISVGDSSCETPYGVLIRGSAVFFY